MKDLRLFLVIALCGGAGYWLGRSDTIRAYRKCFTLNPEQYVCPAWVAEGRR